MRKILLHVQLIIVVLSSTIYDDCRTVFDEARDCATDGSPNMGDYDCQCRQKYCCYRQTCRPEGDGGKGECKSPVAVAIPAHQRFTKCATDGSPNPDKEDCECNFQDAALCQTGQICHPHGGNPEGKVCDIVDKRGRAYCERAAPVKAGPKPSAGTTGSNGGSGGGIGGSSGAGGDAGQGPLRCQSGDGALLASATMCEDRVDDSVCRAVFSNDGAGVRSNKCDLPGKDWAARRT
ncbi:hypothetical protein AAVH_24870 [Aphelenchoides avenae]|nr:hypothetical protein AAVH_24870 [Aphelenchus avenae]